MKTPLENVVDVLINLKEKKIAIELINVFEKHATNLHEYNEIAKLYSNLKQYKLSEKVLKQCLEKKLDDNQLYSIRYNLAKIYNSTNNPQLGLDLLLLNEQLDSNNVEIFLDKALCYYFLGNYKESENIMQQIINSPVASNELKERALYNMSTYELEKGNFKKGTKDHAVIGRKIGIHINKKLPNISVWDGKVQEGLNIVILSEGGLGDEIIGIRFLHYIQEKGMTPYWVTNQKQLIPVLERHKYNYVKTESDIPISNVVQCHAFDLPYLLDLDKHDLWKGKYLTPSEEYIKKWQKILPEGKKYALKWYGNQEYDQDLHRGIDLEALKKLNINDVTLVSVQLEGPPDLPFNVFNAGQYIESVEDTLAILSLCDKTITSCTSVVHMAGALDVPCIVCPPIAAYFPWLGRSDGYSNWYGKNLRVVRQTQHNDWDTVIKKVNLLLQE